MTGLVFAQGAGSAKAPAARAGAGSAKARRLRRRREGREGDPTAAAGSGAAKDAKAPAAAPMEMPKPPAEIAAAVEGARRHVEAARAGAMGGTDMKTEMKFTGTMKSKSDLDGWWMHDSMTARWAKARPP